MQRILTVTILVITTILAGCAGMSKKDCATADWYSYGVQDGQAGQPTSAVNRYVESCSKHDVPINRQQYEQGYEVGIRRFCTPANGYQVGLRGRALPAVCPAEMADAFARAHERGYTEFQIQQDIRSAEQRLDQLAQQREQLLQQLVDAEAQRIAGVKDDAVSPTEIQQALQTNDRDLRSANGQLACASGNWQAAGERDGLAGRSASRYRLHVRECADYHPTPDQNAYIRGQSDGVQQYCRYETGVELGALGLVPTGLCQGANAREQQRGIEDGAVEFEAKVAVSGLTIRRDQLTAELDALSSQINMLEQKLKEADLTTEQKLSLNRDLNRARQQAAQSQSRLTTTTLELDCYVGDWRAIGRADAEQGLVFDNRSAQCRQFGRSVDPNLYEGGYQLGLDAYCTFANGRVQGELGQPYAGICPTATEAAFLDGYAPAFEAYQRAKLRQQLEADLVQADGELSALTEQIDALTRRLESGELSRNERLDLIRDIADLSDSEQSLRAERDLLSAHRQCLSEDWQALGRTHGLSGQDNQLNRLNCSRFGLSVSEADYRQGLNQGLQRWCSYDRGYEQAMALEPQSRVCTQRAIAPYRNGYLAGIAERNRQQTLLELKAEKLDLQEKRLNINDELAVIAQALTSDQLTAEQKQRYERRRNTLQVSRLELNQRLQQIDQSLAELSD